MTKSKTNKHLTLSYKKTISKSDLHPFNPLGFHPYSARETPQLPGLSASGIFRAKTFFVVPYLRYL